MIVEQNKLFGVIPVSRAKEVKPGSEIALKTNDIPGYPFIQEVTMSVRVREGDKVLFRRLIKGALVGFENDTPKEVNQMKIKTGGVLQRVFTYRPNKVSVKA
jgi:hypothetical protein